MSFIKFIKEYKKEHDLSQNKLAKLTGLSQPEIRRLEHGKEPTIYNIKHFAKGLDIPLEELYKLAGYLYKEVEQCYIEDKDMNYKVIFPDKIIHKLKELDINKEEIADTIGFIDKENLKRLKASEEEFEIYDKDNNITIIAEFFRGKIIVKSIIDIIHHIK
ncbi:MAG: helix-turn-helix domain-containing protein [archaeon]